MQNSKDPYSLDQLQDIVLPTPVSWWPPAPVWWFVIALLSVWAFYAAVVGIQRWRQNAYRRAALRELTDIEQRHTRRGNHDEGMVELSVLLKRVAMVTYSRPRVASLSGSRWLAFLDQTCEAVDFSGSAAQRIGSASFDTGVEPPDETQWQQAVAATRTWIGRHEAEAAS